MRELQQQSVTNLIESNLGNSFICFNVSSIAVWSQLALGSYAVTTHVLANNSSGIRQVFENI